MVARGSGVGLGEEKGRDEEVEHGAFSGRETILYNTGMMGLCQNQRRCDIKSEPLGKRPTCLQCWPISCSKQNPLVQGANNKGN